jgi:hypothetical protein
MVKVIVPSAKAVLADSVTFKVETVPAALTVVSQVFTLGVHGPETELNQVAAGFENTGCALLLPA